jgi:hypothetical protein
MTPLKTRERLSAARLARTLVRIHRSCEEGHVTGYVCSLSSELVLVHVVSDDIRFDGFQALRLRDVTRVQAPAPHAAFVERALELRRLRRKRAPVSLDLTSIASLLTTASQAFPLVTIHRELADPDVCHIGTVLGMTATSVTLREITPDARWEKKKVRHALSDITRVDVGGAYENALHIVDQAT